MRRLSQTTIWKFPFSISDTVKVLMPSDAVVLKIDSQGGVPTIWAAVSEDAKEVEHTFLLRGTGHPLGCVGPHIASFFHGPFVWHVFEVYK